MTPAEIRRAAQAAAAATKRPTLGDADELPATDHKMLWRGARERLGTRTLQELDDTHLERAVAMLVAMLAQQQQEDGEAAE